MQHVPVNSSNLASVGYDTAAKVLEVEFREGRVYQYHDVPESAYRALMEDDSKGSHFHRYIRDKYHTTRIK